MTTTEAIQLVPNAPAQGRKFRYSSGRGIALMPAEVDGTWCILNPDTHSVETVRLERVDWQDELVGGEEILRALVMACQATFARAMQDRGDAERLDATIDEIREYAIDKHREGHFCRAGLNEALEHFGLERYEPRYTAVVTVNATAEINADSLEEAGRRIRHLVDGLAYSGENYNDALDITIDEISVTDVEEA